MKLSGIMAASALMLAAAPAAWAGTEPDLGLALVERVQPSAEQTSGIEQLRAGLFSDLEALRAEQAARRAELKQLQQNAFANRVAIAGLERELEALRVRIIERHLEYRAAVRELLTDDQRRQVFALVYGKGTGGGPAIDLTHGSGAGDASSPTDRIDPASTKAEHTFGGLPNSLGPDLHWSNHPYDPTDLLGRLPGGSQSSARLGGFGCAY